MQRGSLAVGALSILGSAGAFAIAAAFGRPVSMYSAIGIVLALNAAVRLRLAASHDAEHRQR
ncbi:MAG: hypothetical protein WC273_10180 [Dehalococcoidia bacterium]